MKTFLLPFLFGGFLFFYSCGNEPRHTATPELPIAEQTPDALLSPESPSDLLSSVKKKRWARNIVDELFLEAMEKDATLKNLNAEIEKIKDKKPELWEPYQTYLTNNNNYWNFSDLYLNNISDSLKKVEIKQIFTKFQNQYQERIQPFENTGEAIARQSISLDNELAILKLMVSAQLMENYQKNELPNLKPLENLVKEYDELIKKTQQEIEKLK